MRLGWAVMTDHFSSRAPDTAPRGRAILLCMGLFSRFCIQALQYTAEQARRHVGGTRSLVLRAYGRIDSTPSHRAVDVREAGERPLRTAKRWKHARMRGRRSGS